MSKTNTIYLFFILFFPFMTSLSTVPSIEEVAAEVPLFYWDARPRLGFSNFGDAMSVSIVERILGRSVSTTTEGKSNF